MTGIAEMFAELEAYELADVDVVIFVRRQQRLQRMRDNTKAWRINNPEKYKALRDQCSKAYRKRNPDKVRARERRYRKRYRAANLEHVRARDRRNKQAERARKKAAQP